MDTFDNSIKELRDTGLESIKKIYSLGNTNSVSEDLVCLLQKEMFRYALGMIYNEMYGELLYESNGITGDLTTTNLCAEAFSS